MAPLRTQRACSDLSHQNLAAKIARYEELAKLRKPVRQRKRRNIESSEPAVNSRVEELEIIPTLRILFVEDNQIVADAVKETLELKGWTVEICSDGTAALDRIEGEAYYDLLVVDYELPGVNGIELVHRVRELPHRSSTPTIMLSATPVEAAAFKAGADEFLPKPQGMSLLVETITRLLGEHEQEGEAT